MSLLLSKKKPFLVLVDFGGNEGSEEALKLIEKANIPYQVIDHHPYETTNPSIFNSWKYDKTGQYTAGYLACEIARMLNRDVESMINVGLAGDKSTIAPITEEDREKALVIDYLTTYTNDINFIIMMLDKPELYQEFRAQAKQKLEEIHDLLGELEYIPIGDIKLYLINIDDIIKRTEFQSSGKIASFLLEREGPDAVVIAQTRNIFVMRVGEGAYKKGVNTKKILDYFKDIGSGGGHEKAGAMRVPPKYMGYVRGEIPRLIKRMVEGAL
ncbi:MAG: hypothetical protein GXN92_00145 [Candidatus Micrarchaeota archaeon]|nr:hypothetical protein [Candidatus Micrarchaeota archaeon]